MTWRGGYHGDTFTPMSVCDPDGGMHSLWTDVLFPQIFAPAAGHYRQGMLVSVPLHLDTLATKPSLADLETVLDEAYRGFHHPAVAPLRQIAPATWLLELFHGPTLAFKDLAMQLLARLMPEGLRVIPMYLIGVILIAAILFMPDGILPRLQRMQQGLDRTDANRLQVMAEQIMQLARDPHPLVRRQGRQQALRHRDRGARRALPRRQPGWWRRRDRLPEHHQGRARRLHAAAGLCGHARHQPGHAQAAV